MALYTVSEVVLDLRLEDAIVGRVDAVKWTEGEKSSAYADALWDARIVVNAEPCHGEIGQRIWETLASGALLLTDRWASPLEPPLINGTHLVFYDPTNPEDLRSKLLHYLHHPEEARRIAVDGYRFALQHHRAVNRADYILSVLDVGVVPRPVTWPLDF